MRKYRVVSYDKTVIAWIATNIAVHDTGFYVFLFEEGRYCSP
jgi:hypothetical protein